MKNLLLAAALLAPALAAGADEYQCKTPDLRITGTIPAGQLQVATYDQTNGKYKTDIDWSAIDTSQTITGCSEDYGLVRVALSDGTTAWLDRASVQLQAGQQSSARVVCVESEASRSSDHKEAAVSGIGTRDCVAGPRTEAGKP
jgi:hypothetical protein